MHLRAEHNLKKRDSLKEDTFRKRGPWGVTDLWEDYSTCQRVVFSYLAAVADAPTRRQPMDTKSTTETRGTQALETGTDISQGDMEVLNYAENGG
jgi:hypothetical protein